MQTELAKLKRRPFLLPLVMPIVLLAAVILFVVWILDARTGTVVVLVPHAETEMSMGADPGLNVYGRERAAKLARMLISPPGAKRSVDAIYATELAGTQQTAMPIAENFGLAVNALSAGAWNNLPRKIRREHSGELVLVVGNATALPAIITSLSDESVTLKENEYDSMFIVYFSPLSKPRLVRLRY